ncbi:Helix-turn-helix [Singulisphaera sp. GP187]|nr:Helix-turn-helix [Singulisphaera sp. GP187]
MGVMNVEQKNTSFDELVAACRTFADCLAAFQACDAETRADIEELIAYARDPDVDELERESLFATIAQALFPMSEVVSSASRDFGSPLSQEEAAACAELDAEEATFASRLSAAMNEKKMTQSALATAIGVGQPAVSMMLSRGCRPQRRTVKKIAEALSIPASDLWPNFHVGKTETHSPVLTNSVPSAKNAALVWESPKTATGHIVWTDLSSGYWTKLEELDALSRSTLKGATLKGAA